MYLHVGYPGYPKADFPIEIKVKFEDPCLTPNSFTVNTQVPLNQYEYKNTAYFSLNPPFESDPA